METEMKKPRNRKKRGKLVGRILLKVACVLLETVILVAIGLYGVMYTLALGPSQTASKLFVRSVRETSAIGFLAEMFFSEEEIAAMENVTDEIQEDMDLSLIQMPNNKENNTGSDSTDGDDAPSGPVADEWGLVDEDGDGIIVVDVTGETYTGYMMVVLDPSRVVMATVPSSYGVRGYTVEQMVKKYDAVAGINAGGFYDPDGTGNGSIPDSLVISDGVAYYGELGCRNGFVGLDSNNILHVGTYTAQQALDAGITSGVSFGPVLIVNGETRSADSLSSGVNPRTGIGQRSDGAILLLVIEGRSVSSLGATYMDMAEIFQSFGAVNACNLDGGSSSMMYYNGSYINSCASVYGVRPVPTAFLVLKEGSDGNE